MPDFAGIETGNICGASRPANTPRQACSLDCIAKLRFAFQPAFAGRHLKKAATASTLLPAPAGQHLPPHIFSYRPHNPPPARNLHSGLTGKQPPANLISPFFFSSHAKKETDFAGFHLFFFFSYNSNPSISFAISFTALLAVQSVYSSAQATQWSYINATRSPVSLILALISAIFSSSSFFNSF